jgi:hypothetical protein
MISGAASNHMPANAAAIFGDRYRRIPEALAFVLAIVISLASALVTGLLGAWAGGLYLAPKIPSANFFPHAYALLACLILPAAATLLALSEIDGDYLLFLLVDGAVIALFSFASWMVCRRWYERSQETYF